MKNTIIIVQNMIMALAVLFLITGCSGSVNSASSTGETGAIVARLVWSDAKPTAKTVDLAPAGVATVRFVISGSSMATVQQDFAASAGTGTIGGVLAGSGRTFTAQGLDGSGTVTYQGSVSNVTVQPGQTTDVGTITMLPVTPATAPTAPSGLTASAISSSQINLTWADNATTETGFKIERKSGTSGTYAQIGTAAANAASYNDTGLTASTAYYYRVRATNSVGDSGYSNEANATTSAASGGGTGVVQLPRTGQTACYDASGAVIACAGTGQDGALQKGVAWPNPRFTDNSNGTVTDNLTGLIWLKNANCFGTQAWTAALTSANTLASGACGLTDGSTAGQWRLPNITELESLVDSERNNPALPAGHPFTSVQSDSYWSSSSYSYNATYAWLVIMYDGIVYGNGKSKYNYVWPVRAGQ
ncbi:MAG: DUF1566 domain-containing protein [Desulfuromonadales bacterium]